MCPAGWQQRGLQTPALRPKGFHTDVGNPNLRHTRIPRGLMARLSRQDTYNSPGIGNALHWLWGRQAQKDHECLVARRVKARVC